MRFSLETGQTLPTVSICIPLYNGEKFIAQAIESVLSQSFTDYEIIISDDCSTDHSVAIATKFLDQDDRIRLVQNEKNLGARANWNQVVREARGRYIKLLHCDDVIYTTCLQRQVSVLDDAANHSVQLVTCQSDVVDEDGTRLISRAFPGFAGKIDGLSAINKCARMGTNLIGEPSLVLFKASGWNEVGPFNDAIPYCTDLDFWVRLLKIGDVYVVNEKLAAFRVSSTSWSFSLRASQASAFREFLRKLRRDPSYHISSADLVTGSSMANAGAIFRQVMYWWVGLRRRSRPVSSPRS